MFPSRGKVSSVITIGTRQPICERLEKAAHKAGAIAFVTTEKDVENLDEDKRAAIPIYVAVIDFVLSAESEFIAALERKLHPSHGASA